MKTSIATVGAVSLGSLLLAGCGAAPTGIFFPTPPPTAVAAAAAPTATPTPAPTMPAHTLSCIVRITNMDTGAVWWMGYRPSNGELASSPPVAGYCDDFVTAMNDSSGPFLASLSELESGTFVCQYADPTLDGVTVSLYGAAADQCKATKGAVYTR